LSIGDQTLQPSPTVLIEAVTKKCKQEVATPPPSPLNTSVKSMSKSNKIPGMGAINTINSVITVITDIRFVGDVAIDVVLVTNGITIINIINLTGGT
jgi:hypothetical protein